LYLELVRATLYRAWDQPTQIGVAGLVARVELSLSSDGSVSASRLLSGSGNAVMDESVMRAVRAVHRIPGLPAEFALSHRRIAVAFELTGNR
jgi:TonB family protein